MERLASGNSTVDAMGTLSLSGNIVPQIWYKTITKETGKPYLLAITGMETSECSSGKSWSSIWKRRTPSDKERRAVGSNSSPP